MARVTHFQQIRTMFLLVVVGAAGRVREPRRIPSHSRTTPAATEKHVRLEDERECERPTGPPMSHY